MVRTLTHDDNIHETLNRRVRLNKQESAVSSGNGEGKEWMFKKMLHTPPHIPQVCEVTRVHGVTHLSI